MNANALTHPGLARLGSAYEVLSAVVISTVSAVAGWLMLAALVMAIPDLDAAAREGGNAFFFALREILPGPVRLVLLGGIVAAQFCCGLATVTSGSRMIYAFARDGGLPASAWLRRVSPAHRTPAAAIWAFGLASVAFAAAIPYLAITAVCVMLLYVSYVMPTLAGLLAWGRTWTTMGPWSLGRWYRPLAAVCVVGGIGLMVVGVQPPNDVALAIVPSFAAALFAWWWVFKRRHFAGPPRTTSRGGSGG